MTLRMQVESPEGNQLIECHAATIPSKGASPKARVAKCSYCAQACVIDCLNGDAIHYTMADSDLICG